MNNILTSFAVATFCTGATFLLALNFGWITEVNWLEIAAVYTSYVSTYLCVVQSRWNYPAGIVSTILLSIFFLQNNLIASAALNIYLPFALLYGWVRWGPDNNTRPVTWLGKNNLWYSYAAWSIGIWIMLFSISIIFGATMPLGDSIIVGLSIMAQLLLDNKRMESWIFWAIGNVLAIGVYAYAGAPVLALQFVLFLGNTLYASYMWHKSIQKKEVVTVYA